uniref:ParA family protein n=1 Tax=Pseudomonadota TaxID=1224 RepID=UPI00210671F1|nr:MULTISPECIES: AAA family ATPase [unclassified Polaromonas]
MDIRQTIKAVSLSDIQAQSDRVSAVMDSVKKSMLAPSSKKTPPVFGSADLQALAGIDKAKLFYRLSQKDLPGGDMRGTRREWKLTDAQEWVRAYRQDAKRPLGASAVTITIANFKGGVAKTTSAVSLAQGLSLKGHKVLLIDLDPQGSATTLFGINPESEVDADITSLSMFMGDQDLIDYAIRPTYWNGIDLVSASPALFAAEFGLPARQMKDPGFEFWRVLDYGLDQARHTYDVIVIDTPPALSYVTINAMLAADGVVIPLPPSALDFASSAQFWGLFSDLCTQLYAGRGTPKTFEFFDVLLSRVESNDTASTVVRQWIIEAYGDKVLPIEIPKTSIASNAAAEFGTVYDLPKGSVSSKTYSRAKDAYDRYCELVEEQIRAVWAKQVSELQEPS